MDVTHNHTQKANRLTHITSDTNQTYTQYITPPHIWQEHWPTDWRLSSETRGIPLPDEDMILTDDIMGNIRTNHVLFLSLRTPRLESMPNAIIHVIMMQLPEKDRRNLRLTNKRMNGVYKMVVHDIKRAVIKTRRGVPDEPICIDCGNYTCQPYAVVASVSLYETLVLF